MLLQIAEIALNYSQFGGQVGLMPARSNRGNRDALATEGTGILLEMSGDRGMAIGTIPVMCDTVLLDVVPVPHNQRVFAGRTVGGISGAVMHIADIDVTQSGVLRDFSGTGK